MATIKKADIARAVRISNCYATFARTEAEMKAAQAAHDTATTDLAAALGGTPEPVAPPEPKVETEPKADNAPVEGVD